MNQQGFFNAISAPVNQGYGLFGSTPIISINASVAEIRERGEIVIKGDNVMKVI